MRWKAMTVAVGAVTLAVVSSGAEAADALPSFNVDWEQVSVSGLSSGAYMAVQVQTAHSADIMGAGIFAGGPYACARGALTLATLSEAIMRCVNIEQVSWGGTSKGSFRNPPNVPDLIANVKNLESAGAIDPLSGLADDKVYLFSGKADRTVPQVVMTALQQWYAEFVPAGQVTGDFGLDAGHAMVTADFKNACDKTELPYINDCDLDGAGKALTAIYGPLVQDQAASGRIVEFDQRAFVPTDWSGAYDGLHEVGHLFVPASCEDGATACKLHVVFHGCQQNQDFIQDDYWMRTGYNEHAAANDIIVLYPQTKASTAGPLDPMNLKNPKGCWDWWGYTDQDYLTKDGVQMQAVWAMVQRVAGRSNQ